MTENEAIIRFDFIRCALLGGTKPHIMPNEENIVLVDAAIQALEEVQQYRQIGTVSTCRNAVGICKAMIERGINPDNITECIKFEYNLVQRGYDLKKLIEMIEEHKQQFQIGTVEECREAVEKQTAISRELIEGKYFCPKCHNLMPYPGYCGCGQKVY
jgi:hypothetical protein